MDVFTPPMVSRWTVITDDPTDFQPALRFRRNAEEVARRKRRGGRTAEVLQIV